MFRKNGQTIRRGFFSRSVAVGLPAVCAGLLAALLWPMPPAVAGTASRTWTSISGATLEARYAGLEGDRVLLERPDGSRLSIALQDLSEQDAAWIEKYTQTVDADRDADGTAAAPAPDKLPVFTSGRWTGYHAVYQHAHFDAAMDADGRLHIQLKHQGEPVGEPIRYYLRPYYNTPDHTIRHVAAFEDPPPPVMQPDQVTLTGMLEHDVRFEVHFEFNGNEIEAWGRSEDPPRLTFPTRHRIMLRFSATHDFEPQVTQEEREQRLKGHALHLRELDGTRLRWREYSYHEAREHLRGRVREARLEVPAWAPRKVSVNARHRNVPLRPWIYAGNALWQGYVLQLIKEDSASRSPTERMVLTID